MANIYAISHVPLPTSSEGLFAFTAWTAAQFEAFINTGNVLHDTLFPSSILPTPIQVSRATSRHISAWRRDREIVKYIQVLDPETGAVAGGAKWYFYSSAFERPAKVAVDWVDEQTFPEMDEPRLGREQRFAQHVMDEFHSRRVRLMPGAHALLDICFVRPQYQKQNIARMLVQYGIDRADKERINTSFTEASPLGRIVYMKLGFEIKEEVVLRFKDDDGEDFSGKGDVVWYHMERHGKLDSKI